MEKLIRWLIKVFLPGRHLHKDPKKGEKTQESEEIPEDLKIYLKKKGGTNE